MIELQQKEINTKTTEIINIIDEKYLFLFFQKQFNNLKLEKCIECRNYALLEPNCFVNGEWIENCLICGYQIRKPKPDDKHFFR